MFFVFGTQYIELGKKPEPKGLQNEVRLERT